MRMPKPLTARPVTSRLPQRITDVLSFVPENPSADFVNSTRTSQGKQIVVVHGGARDAYQLALGLSQQGRLQALVTDLFWSERLERSLLSRLLPARMRRLLRQRSTSGLRPGQVRTVPMAGLGGFIDRLRFLPFALRRWIARRSDAAMGRAAGRLARKTGAGLVSYSYFAYDAFRAYGRGALLFQAHPHPDTMRQLLRRELKQHPDCAESLRKEWELSLPEEDFQHLVRETRMASHYLVASSFTRDSLVANGIAEDRIRVVPYGVDLERFRPASSKRYTRTTKLRLLFVGRINQRKGVKYLVEALRLLPLDQIELMVCGRVVDGLDVFQPVRECVEIRPNVSGDDLVRAYQSADLFVFPSVAEGFGQVLLESLACGLPILSTTHTAAPDLIVNGVEGFVVEPRRPDLLAEHIHWALRNRALLAEMGVRARKRAESFTWERFRNTSAQVIETFLYGQTMSTEREVA